MSADHNFEQCQAECSFVKENPPDVASSSSLETSFIIDDLMNINNTFMNHLNCRSLLPVVDQLRAVFQANSNAILIAITETRLNEDNADVEVHVDVYTIERKDRGTLGGGVAIYVKNGARYIRTDLELSDIEAIGVELKFRKVTYLVVCVYRAPNFSHTVLIDYLDDLTQKSLRECKQIIILGDLNTDCLNNSLPHTRALQDFIV